MAQLALFRRTDPQTSVDAAHAQDAQSCEADILLALKTFLWSKDPTAYDIWRSFMSWREYSSVVTAFSRLKKAGKVEVTGKQVPQGKRLAQSTYAITETGREQLR